MNLVNFDTKKTLEELESPGAKKSGRSPNVSRGHVFRQKPVKDLTTEELRLMIMQNTSLVFLVTVAIDRLHLDALLKGNHYEGDLLNAVLTIEKKFWKEDLNGYVPVLKTIINNATSLIQGSPDSYKEFTTHSGGAIKIFEGNVSHL